MCLLKLRRQSDHKRKQLNNNLNNNLNTSGLLTLWRHMYMDKCEQPCVY